MADCVTLTSQGTLQPTGQPMASCTGYVLLSRSDYSPLILIDRLFTTPTDQELTTAFCSPLIIILVSFVAARLAGTVAGMFNR